MRKRLLASFLCLCLLVGLLPTTALAEGTGTEQPEPLNIADGSIIITEDGYKVGDGEKTLWGDNADHALTITQRDPETPVSNYIEVQSGTVEITLKGVNISCANPFKVSNSGTAVTVILEGENVLTSTGSEGLQIGKGSTVTIKVPEGEDDDYGSLTATGGHNESPGIGGTYGTVNIESGEITAVGGGGYVSGIGPHRRSGMTAINISGGHIINQGNQSLGSCNTNYGSTVNISGGYIETNAVGGTTLTISGGTIVASELTATTISITGGNIGNSYTGDITDRTRVVMTFYDEDNQLLSEREVEVKEGDGTSWFAYTDKSGKVTTYLAKTDNVTAALKGEALKQVTFVGDQGVAGGSCTCGEEESSLTASAESQSVTIYFDEETLALSAARSCVLPEGFHGDYEDITYKVLSVTVNEAAVDEDAISSYASIERSTLSVKRVADVTAYTVQVQAEYGQGESKKISEPFDIQVSVYQSQAQKGELDIGRGTITVTAGSDGKTIYTQGGREVKVAYADEEVTIMGSSVAGEDISVATNMIDIQGGNPSIVLKGITIAMNAVSNGSAADWCRPAVVLRDSQTATIRLEGINTLNGGNQAPGVQIDSGAALTIEGEGTLNAASTNHVGGIGSGRSNSYGTPGGGKLIVKDGTINATGHGNSGAIGSSYDKACASIAIQGGVITTAGSNNSLKANEVTISGGTLLGLHKPISATTLNITGGNIGDSYSGSIGERKLTKLAFFDAEGNPQAGTEVTVTEGTAPDTNTWTALTDENGMITTYLANGTESISATVGDTTYSGIRIAEGLGVVGAFCTCADYPGTLTMITEPQSLTTIDGKATLSGLAATYTKDSCVLPEGFHGDYENNVSFEITKVVKNGQYMQESWYAKIEGTTLTVYDETNRDPYTVYVRAYSGPANSSKAYSNEIAITVNTNAAETGKTVLDISNGSIIITDSGYKQGGGTETAWGGETPHALTITQSDPNTPVSNYIEVQSGTAEITLKGVNLTNSTRSPFSVKNNGTTATVILEGKNKLVSQSGEGLSIENSTVTIKVPEDEDDGYGSLTATGGGSERPGIGGTNGIVNIESGTITAVGGGGYVSGIGPRRRSGMTAINISGGHIINQGNQPLGNSNTSYGSTTNISGGYIETGNVGGSAYSGKINLTISGGTIVTSKTPGIVVGDDTALNITGGNICDSYSDPIEGLELTKLYFVETGGTPKAKMEVTVTEGTAPDANTWTALTDENGVITTYLANTTKKITVSYDGSSDDTAVTIPESHQALIGGSCSCSADTVITGITWETGLPESITLHNLTVEGGQPATMNYDVPAAQLVTDGPCNMPIHPTLPSISYTLSVTTASGEVESGSLSSYATFANGHLVLMPGNAPYTVTLTASVGDGDSKKTASGSIEVKRGDTGGEGEATISTINLSLGNATISYNDNDGTYSYTQGESAVAQTISGTILITGFADNGTVTVTGGSPTLIINQNDPNDEWRIYDGGAEKITLQPRSFNNKLRFGTMDSTMPELSYVSAAPKLKLNPDQGDITFNAGGSVTQGKFTITQLKNNEEIAIWGAELDVERIVTNSTGKSLDMEINGEDVALPGGGNHTIPMPKYTNQDKTSPTTKTYIFDNGNDTYTLIAVGEGDASAPALANEEQEKIKKALLDSDFSGTLGAGSFLFYADLSELHAEQFSNIQVYTGTLGHVYLGAGLTELGWGNYCATTGFTVDPKNPNFTVDEKGVLYSKDYTTLYVIPSRLRGDYTTHEACTTVNANATMMVALDSLTLGKNVSSVTGGSGSYVFFANNLKAINVEAGNAHFASKDGILYNKDMTTILACPRNVQLPDKTLVIPATVTYVEEYIFAGVDIQKLVIPEGAVISGGRGLYRMTGLTEIQMLGSYGGSIAEGDGYRMDQLEKVTVADGYNFSGNTFDYSSMEWLKTAGITITGGDTSYNGKAHSVTISAADGLTVEYLQSDGTTWNEAVPSYTEPGTYTVFWRITKPADYMEATEDTPASGYAFDRVLYSSRTFTITALEADESWFILSEPVVVTNAGSATPVTLNQPAAAPSLENGYTVKYNGSEIKPITADSYLVTVEITADGYAKETLTLGYYTILAEADSEKKVLSFVTNGGTTIEPIVAEQGASVGTVTTTRTGYTFEGWYEDVTLRNKVETFPTSMPSESATYYAKWERENYKIEYHLDGGTDPGNPVSYHVETPTFTLLAPDKPGYKFIGWTWDGQTDPVETVTITKGSTTGDKTYTAKWKEVTYKIIYQDCDTGTKETYTRNDTLNSGISLTQSTEREGYTFIGWTMVVNDTSTIVPITNPKIPQGTLGDITLTGIWLAENQTLTLHANGGKFSDGSETMPITDKFASSLDLSKITPTRSGYKFDGWYTDESCTTPFTGGTMPLTMTIYAKWTYISSGSSGRYAVSAADTENGTVTISHRNAVKGTTVTVTVTPDDGYVLKSLVVADAKGNALQLNDLGKGVYTFKMPEDKVTVTAVFEENTETPTGPFVDVSSDAYYYDAVLWAVEKGITNGTNAAGTTFSPDVEVSRAQMVTFLWRAHGAPKANGANPFTDVSESDYYYDAVLWAVANGVTKGTSATTFSPDMDVTRAQAVTFQWRAAGASEASGSSFDDVAADAWYTDAVTWAVANEITNGTGGNRFSPDVVVSRAQAVTFLYRELA